MVFGGTAAIERECLSSIRAVELQECRDAARTRGKHASGPPAYQDEIHFHSSSHRLQASASSPPLDGFGTSCFVNEGPTRPISSTTMPRPAGKRTAGQDESFIGSVSRFWNRSYVADYVGFALLLLAYSLVGFAMTRTRLAD